MEITGTFLGIKEQKSGISKTGNDWTSSTFCISVDQPFKSTPVFEAFNMHEDLDKISTGSKVTVHFTLDSAEWNGHIFPKVKAYKVTIHQPANPATSDYKF